MKFSSGELEIAQILIDNYIQFKTEAKLFKFTSTGRYASFDFYINNSYLIEFDGETHYATNIHGWHTQESTLSQQERDNIKTKWCIDNNVPLIRIPYWHRGNICFQDLLPTINNVF